MAATPNLSKERLLHAVIAYVADHGVADLSLRRLAADIGTSHRMLIYHFGSKEGLFVEVIRAVEDQQRETLAEFDVDPSLSPPEMARRMWQHLSDPALWPNERLFFEVYGQALQARAHTASFLDDIVESWLQPAEAVRLQHGVPAKRARAQARLDLAMTRGLLLDLLATGDRAGVDDAVEQFISLVEAWRAAQPQGAAAEPARSTTQNIESDADPDAVVTVLADPGHRPDWAAQVVANPDARTVDYFRGIGPDREGGAYLRVLPRPSGGSVVVMTLTRARGAGVRDELATLARLVERA